MLPRRLLWACVVVAAAGCGGGPADDIGRLPVSGSVTLDGQPLAKGQIVFLPSAEAGAATSSGTTIANGEFELDRDQGLPPGSYKVSISSAEAGEELPPGADPMSAPPTVAKELIPEKYNKKTELTAEIKADGSNTLPVFELKSK